MHIFRYMNSENFTFLYNILCLFDWYKNDAWIILTLKFVDFIAHKMPIVSEGWMNQKMKLTIDLYRFSWGLGQDILSAPFLHIKCMLVDLSVVIAFFPTIYKMTDKYCKIIFHDNGNHNIAMRATSCQLIKLLLIVLLIHKHMLLLSVNFKDFLHTDVITLHTLRSVSLCCLIVVDPLNAIQQT